MNAETWCIWQELRQRSKRIFRAVIEGHCTAREYTNAVRFAVDFAFRARYQKVSS